MHHKHGKIPREHTLSLGLRWGEPHCAVQRVMKWGAFETPQTEGLSRAWSRIQIALMLLPPCLGHYHTNEPLGTQGVPASLAFLRLEIHKKDFLMQTHHPTDRPKVTRVAALTTRQPFRACPSRDAPWPDSPGCLEPVPEPDSRHHSTTRQPRWPIPAPSPTSSGSSPCSTACSSCTTWAGTLRFAAGTSSGASHSTTCADYGKMICWNSKLVRLCRPGSLCSFGRLIALSDILPIGFEQARSVSPCSAAKSTSTMRTSAVATITSR